MASFCSNVPKGDEDIDDDKPKGVVNMGDDYAGLEDENATAENREYKDSIDDPDSYRDNAEDR
ncbi:MAG: hypothetical protein KGI08_00345 [Thaumarchaeota archaeon]|nr:hypothetical protein [Nitrososphaerota archaeon]